MAGWWSSPSGRTRRPREKLALPSDVTLVADVERKRIADGFARRGPHVVVLGALIWLTLYLLTAPEYRVQRPLVRGTHLVAEEQVAASSGIAGQNVFLVTSRRAEEAALRVTPLRSAKVGFLWPNVVTVDVTERRPFATWRSGEATFQVSEDGVVLAPAGGESLRVVVTDLDAQPITVGGRVDAEVLADASYLLAALRSAGGGARDFEHSSKHGVIATTDQSVRVAFGRGPDLPSKVSTLRALLEALSARQISPQFIDLREKDRPFFR